jgi:hypothetical protein
MLFESGGYILHFWSSILDCGSGVFCLNVYPKKEDILIGKVRKESYLFYLLLLLCNVINKIMMMIAEINQFIAFAFSFIAFEQFKVTNTPLVVKISSKSKSVFIYI